MCICYKFCGNCFAASATVTIYVEDINDHGPTFTQSVYRTTMSENYEAGVSVTSISATDPDIGSNARMTYTLAEKDREHFYMTSVEATNTGVLKVHKVSTSSHYRRSVCRGLTVRNGKTISVWLN